MTTTVTAAPEYPEFTSEVNVDLIDHMGDETSIVRAARVSTLGSKAEAEEAKGLLAYLYNNKHASPLEHCVLTFRVEAPIFVTREILRHRISSFNEESGRYRELAGRFYMPDEYRPLVQVGKVGNYDFVPGTEQQQEDVHIAIEESCRVAWKEYQYMLEQGIAREVARMVLPVNTYSTIYYTANLRSILNFLSLRVDWGEDAAIQSKPQHEIELVAIQIAFHVQRLYPTVFDLFRKNGFQAV
jgi:thymidylate synthase (FAD)